jgi:hypothetical protein
MTKPYRATPEQWESIERYAEDNAYDACFLELRARIEDLEADALEQSRNQGFCLDHIIRRLEKLEAAQQKIRSGPESPLVERVADAIATQATSAGIVNDRPARAAILDVAAWLRSQDDGLLAFGLDWAKRLEQEANRTTSQEDYD